MLKLYRNNPFWEIRGITLKNGIFSCFACNNHPENRVETLLNCSRSNNILKSQVLRKAGTLNSRCQIDMFIFKGYSINSVENIALMFTWKYIYNSKFTSETLLCVPYAYALKYLFSVFTLMGLPQLLIANEVLKILI